MVVGMESTRTAGRGDVSDSGAQTNVGELSDGELDDRLASLGRERCRVEALLAEAVAEKQRRVGGRAAAATIRERLHVSARQATAEVELASSVASEYRATLAAWRAGRSPRATPASSPESEPTPTTPTSPPYCRWPEAFPSTCLGA